MIMDMRLTSRSEPGPEPEPGTSIDGGLEEALIALTSADNGPVMEGVH